MLIRGALLYWACDCALPLAGEGLLFKPWYWVVGEVVAHSCGCLRGVPLCSCLLLDAVGVGLLCSCVFSAGCVFLLFLGLFGLLYVAVGG